MRLMIFCVLFCITTASGFDGTYPYYGAFLGKYRCGPGVAYSQIKNDPLVDSVQSELASVDKKEFESIAPSDQLAYLINLYNFYTILLIKDNLGEIKVGIRDLSAPWGRKIVRLFGKNVSLDYIEHDLIRKKYHEPRIHFALVCASQGCPSLFKKPYTGIDLESQLIASAQSFFSDERKNRFSRDSIYISEIFKWFGGDFSAYGGYLEFIRRFVDIPDPRHITFLPYNWSLNRVDHCP